MPPGVWVPATGTRGRSIRGMMTTTDTAPPSLDDLSRRLEQALADAPALEALIRFDLGGLGHILLDATAAPPRALPGGEGAAHCTLTLSAEVLDAVLRGELDGTTAFMQGQMTISGDVELAVRLNGLLVQGDEA